jgi:hypothetical protein
MFTFREAYIPLIDVQSAIRPTVFFTLLVH